jgi:hypothetical protein
MKGWALSALLTMAKWFLTDKVLYKARDFVFDYLRKRAAATDNGVDDAAVDIAYEAVNTIIRELSKRYD